MPLYGEARREYQAAKQKETSRQDRDIGKPPDVVDPERRERCRHNLREYLVTYHPSAFPLKFSQDHLDLIDETQRVVLEGGSVVAAFPRGSGKTTIFQRAEIWAALYGHRRFPMLLCADDLKFRQLLKGIKVVLENNELLLEDFPEVIQPIRELERIAIRANGQLCQGEPTYMRWGVEQIVLATTKYSKQAGNAGVAIAGGGLTGAAVRGGVITTPTGEQLRPDCVLIDDPQTRKSAKSQTQCQEREDIINGDILGMAGPGKKMAAMCACTVIYRDDLADRLLDRERSPGWTPIKVSMIKSWPSNTKLWDKYDAVRRQELLEEVEKGAANKYYEEHRAELDAGGQVYWEERVLPGCVSALQSAMNEYYADPRSFMAEKQNSPEASAEGDLAELSPKAVAKRITQHAKGRVPLDTTKITAHIDVQSKLLYWAVCAWTDKFGGHVIDYGTTPKVSRRHFNLATLKRGITQHYKLDQDAALKAAIKEATEYLSSQRWIRDDGAEMSLDMGLIDSRYKTEVVEAGLQLSEARNWTPAYGVGIQAKDAPIATWAKKRGGRRGFHWVIFKPPTRIYTSVFADVNYWKSQAHLALSVPLTHPEALTLFKGAPSTHSMFADQLCAERAVRVEARGRIADEWSLPSNKPDNHFWDNIVGCMVAASIQGIRKETQNVNVQQRRAKRPAKRVRRLNI